jgi:DNA-binding MarR family transcriptional regulator
MSRRPATPRPVAARRPARIDPVAEPLHRHALHLLRRLRLEDAATGMSAARLSALSVLVFGGPCALGALAAAEQVSAPTMTRLVQELEREGWVRREVDTADARSVRLVPTEAATRLLRRGRERRLTALTAALDAVSPSDRAALARALGALERVVAGLRDRAGAAGGGRGAAPRPARRRFD